MTRYRRTQQVGTASNETIVGGHIATVRPNTRVQLIGAHKTPKGNALEVLRELEVVPAAAALPNSGDQLTVPDQWKQESIP